MADSDVKKQRAALPISVIRRIAQILIDDLAYDSCASVNVASKQVYQETGPILWKTFVLWGAKTFCRFPPAAWRKGTAPLCPRTLAVEKEMYREFAEIKTFRGAQWIRYIALPNLADAIMSPDNFMIRSVIERTLGLLSLGDLPKVKAAVLIGRRIGDTRDQPGIMAMLSPEFRHGTDDLTGFSYAIHVFQKLGGSAARNACNDESGIYLISTRKPENLLVPAVEDAYNGFNMPSSLPYVPKLVKVYRSSVSDGRYAATFLEGVRWTAVRRMEGGELRSVELQEGSTEFFRECARLLQKATKSHTELATVLVRFFITHGSSKRSVLAADKNAREILDIVRGTYLRTHPKLRISQLGRFWMGILISGGGSYPAWEVRPFSDEKAIVSRFGRGQNIAVLTVDEWPGL